MKTVEEYLTLAYTIVLRRDEDNDFVARVEELPGCSAHGATTAAALDNLGDAQRLWIQDCIEAGDPVPEPRADAPLPSGKWLQRVPRSLHRKLIHAARADNVSLNQLVTAILSEAVGRRWDTTVLSAIHAHDDVLLPTLTTWEGPSSIDGWSVYEPAPRGAVTAAAEFLAHLTGFSKAKQKDPGHHHLEHCDAD